MLIVARGGGSVEDLWAFNDEGLARTVADVDQDGNADIAMAGTSGFLVFKGAGDFAFRRSPILDFSPQAAQTATKTDGTRATQPPGLMIMAVGGSGQSTPINSPFPAPLRAAVSSMGAPLSGYPIVFSNAGGPAGAVAHQSATADLSRTKPGASESVALLGAATFGGAARRAASAR